MKEEKTTDVLVEEFNFADIDLSANLISLHQEGNKLIGITDKGVRFCQFIKPGKILNKVNGSYVLEDMKVN